MRRLLHVSDLDLGVALGTAYDIGLFASGYETRANSLATRFSLEQFAEPLVFGFKESNAVPQRQRNDEFYRNKWSIEPEILSAEAPGAIAGALQGKVNTGADEVRIFLDISSMSRSWYADAINWARFSPGPSRIILDFGYQSGIYPDVYPSRTVAETTTLSGFEGQSDVRLQTVAIMGLGYDPVTPHAVLEDLQPDLKYAFLARGTSPAALALALSLNKATLDEIDGDVVILPLMSIQEAYRSLGEMSLPHAGIRNVVFVPLGPKPHVLASLLVAAKNEEITCLHVKGSHVAFTDVLPAFEVTACSVVFEADNCESQ